MTEFSPEELERFRTNHELLSCSMMGDAYDRLEELLSAEREAEVLRSRLSEAEAVIINAQAALTPDHPVFWVLDDYDGSMDSIQTLRRERDEARQEAWALRASEAAEIAFAELETARLRSVVDAARAAVADLLQQHPQIREAKAGWFHQSTLDLVKAVDALEATCVCTVDVSASPPRVVDREHGCLVHRDGGMS